jgi:hypothetical protein
MFCLYGVITMPCHAMPGILFGSELSSASARNTSLAKDSRHTKARTIILGKDLLIYFFSFQKALFIGRQLYYKKK